MQYIVAALMANKNFVRHDLRLNAYMVRRTIMAKGQQRKNKEAKKPKKQKQPVVLAGILTV
jgi:translation initiation factor RLI1